MYRLEFVEEAVEELRALRATERGRLLDEIERQLQGSPATASRRRKMLIGATPPWDQARPVWQLRVGDLRVFYDVDEPDRRVIIRAVRRKGRKRTEEIL